MIISIKSEIDSRPVVYPLMWTLKPFGSILVISSNRQLSRLIDDDEYLTFRDISIIIDETGGADDIFEQYGVAQKDYDFIILDRVTSIDFDKCLVLLGNSSSPIFKEDIDAIQNLEDKQKYILIDFGNKSEPKEPKSKQKPKSSTVSKKESNKGKDKGEAEAAEEQVDEEYDPTAKFREMLPEEAAKRVKLKPNKVKFPNYSDIEMVEGDHKFWQTDMNLAKVFFSFLGEPLAITWDKFSKEARRKDESSSNVKK